MLNHVLPWYIVGVHVAAIGQNWIAPIVQPVVDILDARREQQVFLTSERSSQVVENARQLLDAVGTRGLQASGAEEASAQEMCRFTAVVRWERRQRQKVDRRIALQPAAPRRVTSTTGSGRRWARLSPYPTRCRPRSHSALRKGD